MKHWQRERRSFRIWRCRGTGLIFWQWECTLCHPPARGGRYGSGGYQKIVTISFPRHMRVRHQHHQHVAAHGQ
jgi:hypothetical protein